MPNIKILETKELNGQYIQDFKIYKNKIVINTKDTIFNIRYDNQEVLSRIGDFHQWGQIENGYIKNVEKKRTVDNKNYVADTIKITTNIGELLLFFECEKNCDKNPNIVFSK